MELKEFVKILKKNIRLFLVIFLAFILIIPSYFVFQPNKQEVALNLNITRAGSQLAQDYKFDDFYRLQADEKFADTIVEWLKSPNIVATILENSLVEKKNLTFKELKNVFKADKLSSQLVSVMFVVDNEEQAQKIALSIEKQLKTITQELNQSQKQENWFEIIIQGPIIKQKTYNFPLIILLSIIIGLFVGFWTILIKHYLE